MSQHNVVNPAVKHITENFNIFGFGNEEAALLQSIKELLENSIDACKAAHSVTNPRSLSANVIISASNNSNAVVVDVSDEGCGIVDPTSVLQCFQSSKDTTSTTTFNTGRFGVGLSTCLVYSLIKLGTPMRLITKCKESLGATVSDYSMDTNGNPSCVQNRSVNTNGFISGTKIRIELPVGGQDRMSAIKRVVRAMETYLIRIDILPTTFIAIGLSVSVGGLVANMRCAGHDPFLASMVLQSESLLATRFKDRYNAYLERSSHQHSSGTTGGGAGRVTNGTVSTSNTSTTVHAATPLTTTTAAVAATLSHRRRRRCSDTVAVVLERADFTVIVVLSVTESATTAAPSPASTTAATVTGTHSVSAGDILSDSAQSAVSSSAPQTREAHHNLVPSDCLPLQVWRYANHVPLLDYGEDALSCCTSAALRAVKWTDLGYKLRLSLEGSGGGAGAVDGSDEHLSAMSHTLHDGAISTSTTDDAQQLLCPAPQWELHIPTQQQQRPELCALLQTHQPRALLAVDVVANHVPYANMRKTALGKDNPALAKLITDGVQAVLAKLESRHNNGTINRNNDDSAGAGNDAMVDGDHEVPVTAVTVTQDTPLQLQSLFCSKKTYQARQMRDKYLPSIAASVARMVACSQDMRYVRKVLRMFHLPTTAESHHDTDTNSDTDNGRDNGSDSDGDDSSATEGSSQGNSHGNNRSAGTAAATVLDQQALRRAIEEKMLEIIR